ncbi:MAG: PAS domain S-box protein [Anaerolineae bacterium]
MARVNTQVVWIVPLFFAIIVLFRVLTPDAIWYVPGLPGFLDFLLVAIPCAVLAFISGRSYLTNGSLVILFFGSAQLILSGAAAASGWLHYDGAPGEADTVYYLGFAAAGVLHVLAAIRLLVGGRSDRTTRRAPVLTLAYLIALLCAAGLIGFGVAGGLPPFLAARGGPQLFRQVVIGDTIVLFAVSAVVTGLWHSRTHRPFLFWYALAGGMVAVGLVGALISGGVGHATLWLGRVAQYVGIGFFALTIRGVRRNMDARGVRMSDVMALFFREAEANYAALIETATDAIISFGQRGEILLWNSAAERIFGYRRDEALGMNVSRLVAPEASQSVAGDDAIMFAEAGQNTLLGRTLEIKAQRKDGTVFPAELSRSVRKTDYGWVGTYIVRDITRRKEGEAEREQLLADVERQAGELESMIESIANAVVIFDRDARVVRVNSAARAMFGHCYENGQLSFVGQTNSLVLYAADRRPVSPENAPVTRALRGETVRGVPYRVSAPDGGEPLWVSVSSAPIRDGTGEVSGAVFTATDITEQRRLLQRAEEQKQREGELARALAYERDMLQAIMENTHTHLVYFDANFCFVRANAAYVQGSGYTYEKLIGRNHFDLFPDAANEEIFRRVRETGQPVSYHARPFVYPDRPDMGVTFWDWTLVPIKNIDGAVEGLVLSLLDVTERVRGAQERERLLRENRQQRVFLQRLVEDAPVAIGVVTALDHRLELTNPAFETIPGAFRRPMMGRTLSEALPATMLDDVTQPIEDAVRTGRTSSIRAYRMNLGPGYEDTYWDVDYVPLKAADETVDRVLVLARDVTDMVHSRKQLEDLAAQVAEEHSFLRAVMDSAPEGVVVLDAMGRVTMANHAADQLLGRNGAWKDDEGRIVLTFYHPDGRPYDPRDLPPLRSATEARTYSNVEMAILRPDGERRELLMNSVPLLSSDDRPSGAVAAFLDITERVRAEKELQRHREHLEELVAARTVELRQTNERLQAEVVERGRAEEMLRQVAGRLRVTNQRLITMSRVGLKVQQTLQSDDIYDVVTEELRKMGFNSLILLRDAGVFVPRHASIDRQQLERLGALSGITECVHIPVEIPILREAVELGRTLYLPDALAMFDQVLPSRITDDFRDEIMRLGLTRAICAPLTGQAGLVGLLCIFAADLGQGDEPAISVIAHQLSIAVENATLFQAVARQREELRALTGRLAEAEESERRRVAQELHDQVGQTLSVLGINLSFLRAQMPAELLDTMGSHLDDSMGLLEQAIDRTRNVMADLRPPVLDDYGLVAALRWYGVQFATRTGISVNIEGTEPSPRLDAPVEIGLFRIAQEALTNVAKHARARNVTITVNEDEDRGVLCLTVVDDGIGFNPIKPDERNDHRGWGLLSMNERAEAVGGRLHIESSPGKGTQLVVEVKQ